MTELISTEAVETKAADIGLRADTVLAAGLEDISRSRIQQLMEEGCVSIDGAPVSKSYRVRSGDVFICQIPVPLPYQAVPENIPLDIVYADNEIIVINKPRGMVVHPAPGHYSGTLVNALLYYCGALSNEGGALRPGIVHRLDRMTSGLLVAAKTDRAHRRLAAQLAERTAARVYRAVVRNNVREERFTVDLPVGRHPKDRKRMAVTPANGRRAVTHVRVLERLGAYTLVEARLETGRTHQIRVHMAHLGHPVLGDAVYGGEKQPFGLDGQLLHAKSLGVVHPVTDKPLFFDSELPDYFARVLDTLRGKY